MSEPKPSSGTQHLLIVEDDSAIAKGLRDALEFEGFSVSHCDTGAGALKHVAMQKPDCMILDLMLPDLNGYAVCETLRKAGHRFPIVMLTARGQESDKIRGLDVGADDYITKPFSIGELVARIRAIFRRIERLEGETGRNHVFSLGAIQVDPAGQKIVKGKHTIALSFYETEILRVLHERQGTPVSRDELLSKIWGIEAGPNNRTVDNCIVKLRKKIEDDPNQPQFILTVYGQGYRLVSSG